MRRRQPWRLPIFDESGHLWGWSGPLGRYRAPLAAMVPTSSAERLALEVRRNVRWARVVGPAQLVTWLRMARRHAWFNGGHVPTVVRFAEATGLVAMQPITTITRKGEEVLAYLTREWR